MVFVKTTNAQRYQKFIPESFIKQLDDIFSNKIQLLLTRHEQQLIG
jgi:hypothetical protein